jgi:hypothetical protein
VGVKGAVFQKSPLLGAVLRLAEGIVKYIGAVVMTDRIKIQFAFDEVGRIQISIKNALLIP